MEYGLIGRTLAHSFSPRIHSEFGDYEYKLYPLEPKDLDSFMRSRNFKGLNVTIPYKLSVVPYCDELTPEAASIGCVNTLKVLENGKLIGHNTDIYGMCAMFNRAGIDISGRKVLILGSGGTSLTATAAAKQLGAGKIIIISRNGRDNYTNLHKHFDAEIIINTTPVGMYPNTGKSPVPLQLFPHIRGVADVIYNPLRIFIMYIFSNN